MIKKICLTLLLLVCGFIGSYLKPSEKIRVFYDYTIDGDTVCLVENGIKQKYRLLYVDTPEYTKEIEPYGKEATELTQQLLENADLIEVEYQLDNQTEDKYQRKLVWLFVDGKLLQEELARAGFVEDVYDNGGNYQYKLQILKSIVEARVNNKGIYAN